MTTTKLPVLEDWCLRQSGDRYTAPERRTTHACGRVDGKEIASAAILSTEGRVITCADGASYELGEPDPAYAAWVEAQGKAIDPVQPVKVRGGAS